MKEQLKELLKEFVSECREIQKERRFNDEIKPSFKNFICWIDDKTYDIR